MNKLNPLFEAVSNIDDNIASAAIKEKRRKPIALMIAAAAAAVTLLVGFTNYARIHHSVEYDKGSFELKVTLHDEVIVPEEYKSYRYTMYTMEDMTAEEMFEMFNVKPLITDKFEFNPDYGDLGPAVSSGSVEFRCSLRNKTVDRDLRLLSCYIFGNYDTTFSGVHLSGAKDYKIVALNDGSRAIISDNESSISATFAYDGVKYSWYMYDGGTMEEMEQVLADLGVL